jgi:molybdopterin-guanine dinucleotide biosynthesis protein A
MHDVIILAAGRLEQEFAAHYNVESKAYIPLKGKMMVEHVLETLSAVALARKVLVVPGTTLPESLKHRIDHSATGGRTIVDSMKSGLLALPSPTKKVLILPCDIPLLSREALEDFLLACEKRDADLYYSYVSREDSEKKYPGLRHTYARLRDGTFCGGSLFMLSPQIMARCEDLFTSITGARKNPLKIAQLLGASTIIKFLMRALSISDIEKKVSALLGARAIAIQSHHADMAFNVDDLAVLQAALEFL